VSVLHLIPLGGEDLTGYTGPARLVVATGDESFDTVADGQPVVHTASAGEIVWRDDVGVTCRRWNWRQCVRTRLGGSTSSILFIVDGLAPMTSDALENAGVALVEALTAGSPEAIATTRLLG
jgi:DNA/RNA-binding domain of Phe-tRNA-synthetase-like protein